MALITELSLRSMLSAGIPNPFPIEAGDKITPAAIDFLKGRGIQVKPSQPNEAANDQPSSIPVGVSNRHVHLSQEHVEALFGKGHTLTPLRNLSQPGQFATAEVLTLHGPKGMIQHVRVLGPARGESQVEISRTDGFVLGIHPPVRLSGSIEGTPGITLIGPKGFVTLGRGVIIAKCHVHMSVEEAKQYGVTHGDSLVLRTAGERPIIFPDVSVRVSPQFALDFHIDLDEANAANLKTGDTVLIAGKNGVLHRGEAG
ncbi:phosphate propanoyltransferase [Brevibacillus fluminis]|uniref:Phosphate propanoyltransferase n=1 Tax=Brevibacillus fluminis TaxID=511487 RepID=A0A3M8DQU3_9BACL|nr:phosphate propanoyltransferase [Brevibacillus fluminis]RNB90493.1 phosphate propanoyltransferase [Brevibacillus fluminis]